MWRFITYVDINVVTHYYNHPCTAVTVVGYELSMYTLVEEDGRLEICVVVTKNGSQTPFIVSINTTKGTAGEM